MRIAVILLALALNISCGGAPDLSPASQVTLTLTPLSATIPVNGTVDLQGSITGLSAPTLDWWMQEQHDRGINGSQDCDHITPANQALIANCPFGYLTGSGMIRRRPAPRPITRRPHPGRTTSRSAAFNPALNNGANG